MRKLCGNAREFFVCKIEVGNVLNAVFVVMSFVTKSFKHSKGNGAF